MPILVGIAQQYTVVLPASSVVTELMIEAYWLAEDST